MMVLNFGKLLQSWFKKTDKEETEMWYRGKQISRQIITDYEREIGYQFPKDFTAVAMKHDGAYVTINVFDTEIGELDINNLLSFDKNAPDSIWTVPEFEDQSFYSKYVIFAGDCCGNYICFDRKDDSVVFIDHETEEVTFVAPSFREFVTMLREDEE